MAEGLAGFGVASLRFDLRGHGQSEGRQEEVTISSLANDVLFAALHTRYLARSGPLVVIGTGVGGGAAALFASRHPDLVRRLVLLDPVLDFEQHFVNDMPYWHHGRIDGPEGSRLAEDGFLLHPSGFRMGCPLLNEVFDLHAARDIVTPTLIVNGPGDTPVPEHIRRIEVVAPAQVIWSIVEWATSAAG